MGKVGRDVARHAISIIADFLVSPWVVFNSGLVEGLFLLLNTLVDELKRSYLNNMAVKLR